ncbi:MAG: hypothetical protein ACRDSL_10765 [Pseudonocardiaceae bacterium]
MGCQAAAALYALLLAHPIDRRGRCRSCRRSGAVLGLRRRSCRVYLEAGFFLLSAGELLRTQLVRELGLPDPPLPEAQDQPQPTSPAAEPDIAHAARVMTDPGGPPRASSQAPAVSPPRPPHRFPGAGWPDLDHGGVGDDPDGLRPRRGPHRDPPTGSDTRPLLSTGGARHAWHHQH